MPPVVARALFFALTGAVLFVATGQEPKPSDSRAAEMKRSQIEEMLKQDHARSIEDAGKISNLADELKAELEKSDRHVLSVAALRKAEEIEKLAKRIKGRMRRF